MPNIKRGMMGAAGVSTSAAVPGELWTWGKNTNGQLGIGTVIDKSSPVQVGSLTDWTVLNKSRNEGFVENEDGDVWVWGENVDGQLGINSVIKQSSPVQLEATGTWVEIASPSNVGCTIGLKENGTIWTWGSNAYGSQGQGDSGVKRSSPTQVGSLTDWANVTTVARSCGAVKTDGTLWFWGGGAYGVSGKGEDPAINYSSPVQVGSLTNWSKIYGGASGFHGIKTDGTLWAWGTNTQGQLGLGDKINRSSPVQVGSLTDWAFADGGGQFSGFLKTDGTLWTVGLNFGMLGDETTIHRSSPVQVGSATNWTKLTTGDYCCLAINDAGELWAWGKNEGGQMGLGEGTDVRSSSPAQVGSLTTWVDVRSRGTGTTRAIKTAS